MALTARLAPVLLVAALATGCNQSLFDAHLGADDPTGDGGNPAPDASSGGRDGGDDERDGAPSSPDARVVDAGPPLPPEYVEIYEGPDDTIGDVVMQPGTWNGLEAWVALDAALEIRSAIVNCPAHPDSEYCTGLPPNALLFVSTNDTHRPALRWTSTFVRILVDFQWLVSESALTTPPATMRILQNGVVIRTGMAEELGQTDGALLPVDTAVGDVLQLIPAAGDPAGGRIGMYVNFLERGTLTESLR